MTDELVIDEDYVEEDEFFFEEEPNTETAQFVIKDRTMFTFSL